MAKKKRSSKKSKSRKSARKSGGNKGQIPLDILENRAKKLVKLVERRGGFVEV